MKILIMNDYLIYGGAEMQSIREKKILEERGHKVFLLTFDENFPKNDKYFNEKNNFINIPIKKSFVKKVVNIANIYRVNKKVLRKIEEVIEKISPNIIHANNLMLDSLTQFEAVRKYKVVQTIRDYTAVCPLGTCIKKNNKECRGETFNNCYFECGNSPRDLLKIAAHKKVNKERKNTIKNYISPSEKLTEVCSNNNYNIKCINNPFDFEKFSNLNKNVDFDIKKYLYYGVIDKNKGVLQLLDAFEGFSKGKDVELLIAGKIDPKIENEFKNKIKDKTNINYLGKLNYDEMVKVLEKVYTIVVPSIWMENYPNTVLEGLSTKTFVIGSNRGGIPEMLSNNRGFVFDPNDINDIKKCLTKSYELKKQEYDEIVSKNKQYVLNNNSFNKYYINLMSQLEKIK